MTEDDITAFRPVASAAPAAPARRRVWPWVLLGAMALVLALAVVGAALVTQWSDLAGNNVTITVDDETVSLGSIGPGQGLAVAFGLAIALLVVLVVVPVALLLAFGAAALGIVVAVIAMLGVVAVAASPLLLLVAIAWWAMRARRPRAISSSA